MTVMFLLQSYYPQHYLKRMIERIFEKKENTKKTTTNKKNQFENTNSIVFNLCCDIT